MQAADNIILAGTDGSLVPVVARNAEVLGSYPGRVGCSSSSLCIYSVCGTVHYKEPLKSFDMSRV